MDQPFEIVHIIRLVPGQAGCREAQELSIRFGQRMLDLLPTMDCLGLKLLIALALQARLGNDREVEQLQQLEVLTADEGARLIAVATAVELGRLVGTDRRTVEDRCAALAAEGWVAIRELPRSAWLRFGGSRLYLLAPAEILYTHQGEPGGAQAPGQGDCTRDVQALPPAGGDNVPGMPDGCTPDVHRPAPMEMVMREKGGTETTAPVVVAAPALTQEIWPTMAPALVALLDQLVRRLGERQSNGTEDGRPALSGYESYKAVLDGLSSPSALAAVSRETPAALVEDLVVLACSLTLCGGSRIVDAVDVVLGQAGPVPDFRLDQLWPHVPGAAQTALHLGLLGQEGGRLPDGGGFRHARTLFVLLNRFTVGAGLLRDFLGLCQKLGVKPVHAVLKRALREGRPGVSILFLRNGVAAWKREQAGRQPGRTAVAVSDTMATERMESRLSAYGVADPALGELLAADGIEVRAWMLCLDADRKLSQDSRCRILICRAREGTRAPAKFRRLAEALERLTPEQEEWLEEHCPQPGIVYWSGDPESVGIDPATADLWHEVYQY